MSYTGAYTSHSQPSSAPHLKTYTYRTCSKAYPEMRSLALLACGMPENDYHTGRGATTASRHYQPSRPTYVEPTYTYQPYVTATPAYIPRSLGASPTYVHNPYDDDLLYYQPPGSLGTTHSYRPYYSGVAGRRRIARTVDDDDSGDDAPRPGPSASGYKYTPRTYCPRESYKPGGAATSAPSKSSKVDDDEIEKPPRHRETPISDQVAMLEKLRDLRRELGKDERELNNAKLILQGMQR